MKGFLAAVVVCVLLVACSDDNAPDVSALLYETAKPLSDFKLTDQNEQLVTKQDFSGQWNLLFLGYTSCPDICPLTLAKLNNVYNNLTAQYPLQIWFLSVDPQRDTAAKRKAYIDYFNPDFLAVSGSHKDLFPFVRELGLIYAIRDTDESEYLVDHSGSVVLVDPHGSVRAIFKAEFKAGAAATINSKSLIDDFKRIAEFYRD